MKNNFKKNYLGAVVELEPKLIFKKGSGSIFGSKIDNKGSG